MDKEAVKAVNALESWKRSLSILGTELIGQTDPESGAMQTNGDEKVIDAVDNLIAVISERVQEIRVKGYIPKKKFKK